jgi:predicted transcriptional regulator
MTLVTCVLVRFVVHYNQSETIKVRITPELKMQLQQIAEAQGVSLSKVVRDALFEFVTRQIEKDNIDG